MFHGCICLLKVVEIVVGQIDGPLLKTSKLVFNALLREGLLLK